MTNDRYTRQADHVDASDLALERHTSFAGRLELAALREGAAIASRKLFG